MPNHLQDSSAHLHTLALSSRPSSRQMPGRRRARHAAAARPPPLLHIPESLTQRRIARMALGHSTLELGISVGGFGRGANAEQEVLAPPRSPLSGAPREHQAAMGRAETAGGVVSEHSSPLLGGAASPRAVALPSMSPAAASARSGASFSYRMREWGWRPPLPRAAAAGDPPAACPNAPASPPALLQPPSHAASASASWPAARARRRA